jgi:hypothetical protein
MGFEGNFFSAAHAPERGQATIETMKMKAISLALEFSALFMFFSPGLCSYSTFRSSATFPQSANFIEIQPPEGSRLDRFAFSKKVYDLAQSIRIDENYLPNELNI